MGPAALDEFCKISDGLICDVVVDIIAGQSELDSSAAVTNFVAHFPAGISMKGVDHYAQSIRNGGFKEFDYGKNRNMQEYGQFEPPSYDLSKISVPTALFVGEHDDLGDPEDVDGFLVPEIGANPNLVFH